MSERFDRYNLAARLEKFGDQLMTAIERYEAIDNRIDVCNQINAVRRIVVTLKALRIEARCAEPDSGLPAARCENIPPRLQLSTERPAPMIPAGLILTPATNDPRSSRPGR